MESMVWAPKRAKGAASAGLERVLAMRLDASVDASTEDIACMTLFWGKTVLFWLYVLPAYPICKFGSIGSGVGPCQCTIIPCNGSTM